MISDVLQYLFFFKLFFLRNIYHIGIINPWYMSTTTYLTKCIDMEFPQMFYIKKIYIYYAKTYRINILV